MKEIVKRVGIFCMYDTNGDVADYVVYLLQQATSVMDDIFIVCNGKLSEEGGERLKPFAADISVRDNFGFDTGAWKTALFSHEQIFADYDELVLFNDSFYGPLYDFCDIFKEMEACDADFWGITVHGKAKDLLKISPYGYIPEHLQSYFIVVRKRMLCAEGFRTYWEGTSNAATFDEAVAKHEIRFTKFFADMGFTYAAYCDTRLYEQESDNKVNPYIYYQMRLLKEYHCPIVKRKALLVPRNAFLGMNYGTEPKAVLSYIDKHTEYDVSLIYKHLLKTQNLTVLKDAFALDYILPDNVLLDENVHLPQKVAVIAHLYYSDLIGECLDYLARIPDFIDIYITVGLDETKALIEEETKKRNIAVTIRQAPKRGRDLGALCIACGDIFDKYEYVCFIHDKKSLRKGQSIVIGEAFYYLLWENTLKSRQFILNVLAAFQKEPDLGLLVPPPPYHGAYCPMKFYYWTSTCYDETVRLAERLGIPTDNIKIASTPLALGSVFWCRSAALKKIFAKKWQEDDFPEEPMPDDGTVSHALERIFPFAAQCEGYYTGWLMNPEFAANHMENLKYVIADVYDLKTLVKKFIKTAVPEKYWFLFGYVKTAYHKLLGLRGVGTF